MKHGDKAKAKTAKASSKASVKKTSKNGGTPKKSKAVKAVKASKAAKAVKSSSGKGVKTAETGKAAGREAVDRQKVAGNGRNAVDTGGFSNAAIAAAFKRAVKKYSNAFRRLTD